MTGSNVIHSVAPSKEAELKRPDWDKIVKFFGSDKPIRFRNDIASFNANVRPECPESLEVQINRAIANIAAAWQ